MSETDEMLPQNQVNLNNCDREPIHILGNVQDYGCLIAVSGDGMVTHASKNCEDILGLSADSLCSQRMTDVFPRESVHYLNAKMHALTYPNANVRAFNYPLFEDERRFDISAHNNGRYFILEFERRIHQEEARDDANTVQALIARAQRHDKLERWTNEAVRGLRLLSGFDRVMLYRFAEDGSGSVIAEAVAHGVESFLGLHYPASDIPSQARALYVRSPLRIIADVDAPIHAVVPELDAYKEPLDLSLAVTRAVSPIHLEYLRNMQVAASMSVSVVVQGKLWGLFACHHGTPRYLDYQKRSAIELFAQLFNYELAQIEAKNQLVDVDLAQQLHDRLMLQFSDDKGIEASFDILVNDIGDVIPFDGAAILSNGVYKAVGSAPTEEEFMGLIRFLNTTRTGQIYANDNLIESYAKASDFSDRVAGLLALPISRTPRDYLVLFRREIAKSVKWAGNPEKPVELGPNGARLTPRKSFDAWQEVVRGHCAPWREVERRAAEALRVTLIEVVLKLSDESNAARKKAQEQQELLVAELNHRVRNILNLIRGLVSQSTMHSTSVDAFRSVLDSRIHALARAHDQLTRSDWSWVSLAELIDVEFSAYVAEKSSRVQITGVELEVSPTAFTTLALLIHELVTNAAKHGALSSPSGSVSINLKFDDNGNAVLEWREHNGPPVKAPTRSGFGTTIIENSVPYELKGKASIRYRMTGLEADFSLPSQYVRVSQASVDSTRPAAVEMLLVAELTGNALVLEDNMIIALDASDLLSELGADDVRIAANVSDALQILDNGLIEFALLDVNLGGELSFPVVEACIERGITAVIATGYGASDDLLTKFPTMPILKKPYLIQDIRQAFAQAREVEGG